MARMKEDMLLDAAFYGLIVVAIILSADLGFYMLAAALALGGGTKALITIKTGGTQDGEGRV